eukprot:GEMP01011625.1.p1 GENE.GEMP01011625.1~~GEMP01011625.1.p1  ORF type:complete len:726 (+),score=131.40 GEMP01011625.1:170-2347(+)
MFWIAVMFALAGAQVVPNFNEKLSQCLKTCKMNCGLTLCGDGDHKCTVTKKHADLCVEMSVGEIGSNPPWAGPDLPKSTFKFRWCQAKYRMWRAPVTDNGLPEGKFVYPRMGKEHGAYLGEDHLHWLTPGCSWAADDNNCTKTLIMDEENYAHLQSDWLALEGHTCARLSTSKCQEDCTEFCELGCNCAWSEDAANSFTRDGVVMRWQRAADSPEWSCHKSFVFDKTCWCENGTGGVKDSCLVQNVHFCQACDAGFHLARDDESSRCVANECICSNGHGAVGPPDCAEDGNHVCVTCDDDEGFFLPELFGVCKVKKCLCNNGSGAVGKACPKHGNHTCTPPCYEGYHHIAEHKTCEITCESSFYVCGGHSLVRDEDKNAALCSSGDGGVCTDGLCCTPRYTVTSFTGGSLGFADGYRSEAQFNFPNGIAVASDGSVYIADSYNSRIRLIAPNGTVSTLAGTGEAGFRDGDAHNAQFYRPTGVDIGEGSNVYVTDYWNHRIRRIDTTTRHVTTVAGNGVRGFLDGYASDALFNNPIDLAVDVKAGKIYVVDRNNHRIRCISHSQVVTLAGTGGKSFCDGNAEEAMFDSPEGIVLSPTDDIYIADAQNNRIRRIDMKSTPYLVSTVAGTGKRGSRDGPAKQATFKYPIGVALDAEGFLYVSDSEDNRIRRVSPKGIVITLAGTGVRGFLDGDAVDAQFRYLRGLAVSPNGELYAAGESRIRRIQVGR